MNPSVLWLAIELFLCWALVGPAALSMQAPGFDGGKLEIKSVPEGARISVNDKQLEQLTNAAFVVSPGNYKVAVTGGSGPLNCGDRNVYISSGSDVIVTCTAKGWQ